MDMEIIKARMQEIADLAACTDCGTTRKECDRMREQNDPTAPRWFGCCSTGGAPCRHLEDPRLHKALIHEVASGTIRPPADEIGPLHDRPRKVTFDWLLHQGEYWRPRQGGMVRIADMGKTWRYNTARMLLRKARAIALSQHARMGAIVDDPMLGPSGDGATMAVEREMQDMIDHPEEWVSGTALLRALQDGLPTEGKKLRKLAERARHYSTCPCRRKPSALSDCTCAVMAGFEG